MNNIYHEYLNVPVNFEPIYPNTNDPMSEYPIDRINQEMLDWIRSKDLDVTHAEIFHLSPNGVDHLPIHIDGYKIDNHVKINYVYCDTPSTMNWFKIDDESNIVKSKTPIGTDYMGAPEENCTLVHSAKIGQPSLVNVGVPHSISPVQSDRYCFSIVLKQKGSKNLKLQWEDAVKYFKDEIAR